MSKKKYILLEMLSFIGFLMAVNFIWFRDDLGFHRFNPNPLWLVIVLTSARYGTNWGILSSILVGAIYLITPPGGEVPLVEKVPVVASFLIIGFILGGLRDSLERKLKEWQDRFGRQKEELESINSRCLALDNLRRDLEKKVLSQTSTVITLYETARSLGNLDLAKLLPTIPRVVKEYIGAERCSLYLIEGENFRLKASLGYPAESPPPERTSVAEGIMGKVAGSGEMVTIQDPEFESLRKEQGDGRRIMCAPLKSMTGRTIGVINVDRLPFVKFTRSSVKLLSVIADWASRAIENATRYGRAEANRIDDEVARAYNAKYMKIRLEEEFKKAVRYKTVFSVIIIRIEDYSLFTTPEMEATILGILGSAFSLTLRGTDTIGRDENEDSFILILPFADEDKAKTVEERLVSCVKDFYLKPYGDESRLRFSTGRTTLNPRIETPEELLRQTRDNLQRAD